VPPRERRGVVIIDPPYEQPDELERLVDGLAAAHRKWATGIYLVWYPVKEPRKSEAFARKLIRLGIPKMLRAELAIAPPRPSERLTASGLIIINPPWKLASELQMLLPGLAPILARKGPSRFRLDWLTGEN
jgi:23S rRNA (adenine2030-N6)-methyltransferase